MRWHKLCRWLSKRVTTPVLQKIYHGLPELKMHSKCFIKNLPQLLVNLKQSTSKSNCHVFNYETAKNNVMKEVGNLDKFVLLYKPSTEYIYTVIIRTESRQRQNAYRFWQHTADLALIRSPIILSATEILPYWKTANQKWNMNIGGKSNRISSCDNLSVVMQIVKR